MKLAVTTFFSPYYALKVKIGTQSPCIVPSGSDGVSVKEHYETDTVISMQRVRYIGTPSTLGQVRSH